MLKFLPQLRIIKIHIIAKFKQILCHRDRDIAKSGNFWQKSGKSLAKVAQVALRQKRQLVISHETEK